MVVGKREATGKFRLDAQLLACRWAVEELIVWRMGVSLLFTWEKIIKYFLHSIYDHNGFTGKFSHEVMWLCSSITLVNFRNP